MGLFTNGLLYRFKFRYHEEGTSNHVAVGRTVVFLASNPRSAEQDTN